MRKIIILGTLLLFIISSCSEIKDKQEEKSVYPKPTDVVCPGPTGDIGKEETITLKSGVVVKKQGEEYTYLGDILLSKRDLENLNEKGRIFTDIDAKYDPKKVTFLGQPLPPESGMYYYDEKIPTAVGYDRNVRAFWTMVRYKFHENINSYQKEQILEAIKYMEKETNVRFYDSTEEPDKHPTLKFTYPNIVFTASYKNQSYVGKIGGNQPLYLHDFHSRGVIVHEICHALGMFHEHNRIDRDDYISINEENIIPEYKDQFQKVLDNYFIVEGGFDFQSVMLYGSYYFAKNLTKPTITRRDNGKTFNVQRSGLSEADRKWINRFYLPYVARKDVCSQLDKVVYDIDNRIISETEREELEKNLNEGRCRYPLPPD